jgi:hypothetical protein
LTQSGSKREKNLQHNKGAKDGAVTEDAQRLEEIAAKVHELQIAILALQRAVKAETRWTLLTAGLVVAGFIATWALLLYELGLIH